MALVVLLKGVNVGGYRTFRPSVLASQLSRFDVVNVGAAGTFVVRGRVSHSALRAAIARRLPFEADVMICNGSDIVRFAGRDPLAEQPSGRDAVRFVSVLARQPGRLPSLPLDLPARGKWLLRLVECEPPFVFGVYRREMKAIGYLRAIDGLFGVPATTRGLGTIRAIAAALERAPS